ncbi:MAG: N-6 DNA methylase, partial [Candidatus Lokiarchaeota archaeon]|nr:N-6 DNA methylase [Candidatus Lokiarchaeota archaeon]
MIEFSHFLEKEKIIERLIDYYGIKDSNSEILNDLKRFLRELKYLNENKTEKSTYKKPIELLIKFYELRMSHQQRKKLGEFYTSRDIVTYIFNQIGYSSKINIENKKILDPSCGSGSFLVEAVLRIIQFFLNEVDKNSLKDLNSQEVKILISMIKKNVHGIDINPIACILCQINIHYVLLEAYKCLIIDGDFELPYFNIINRNAISYDLDDDYSFIVGNPPYVFIRNIPQKERRLIETTKFYTNQGQYDYYQIFIELGIRSLKNDGFLGYIVPDSLLVLSNREILRKFIYENTRIKEIFHTGPKFEDPVVSNIILILQKDENENSRLNNKINIKLANSEQNSIKKIIQKRFQNPGYKFLINLNDKDLTILNHLNCFPKLKNLNQKEGFKLSLSRGVELAKTGEIIYCDRCELFYPIPKKALICPECRS